METGERSVAVLDQKVRELSAHIHAATCELISLIIAFEKTGAWNDNTLRSFAHWLTVCCGFGLGTARELVRVGQALGGMPAIRAAFASGELSFDKVRLITEVATAEDEHHWAEMAKALSAGQLARICRKYRLTLAAEEPGRSEAQTAARGLWARYKDDGMLHLLAKLPPEEGALVMATLDSLTGRRPLPDDSGAEVRDPAQVAGDRWAANQVDALVRVFEHAQQAVGAGQGEPPEGKPAEPLPPLARAQVVVHVDEAVLTGERRDGRCEIENGPPIDAGTARRMASDAELITIIEREGSPLDVGRARRRVSPRMRRALEARDRHCRFPGCQTDAHRCESDHLDEWSMGGSTDLGRLMLMCKFHHLRRHQGAFEIIEHPDGKIDFVGRDGRRIVASQPCPVDPITGGAAHLRREHAAQEIGIDRWTPLAKAAGERVDLHFALDVLLDNRRGVNAPPADNSPPPRVTLEDPPELDDAIEPHQPDDPPAEDWDDPPNLEQEELEASSFEPYQPDDRDRDLLRVIGERGSACPTLLVQRLGLGITDVMVRLGRMEINGLVSHTPTGYVAAGP